MPESLSFHFEGALADEHRMNFYESARFQYAAARLMVKLAQFRRTGAFKQNITSKSNVDIELVTQTDGSFNINVEVPDQDHANEEFVKISVGDLIAYVSERMIEKIDQQAFQDSTLPDGRKKLGSVSGSTLNQLVENAMGGTNFTDRLPELVQDSVKRRVAEVYRQRRLDENKGAIARIDLARSQKLISMSAPLISEMATALRQSAKSLEITEASGRKSRSILYLNRQMAAEIETAIVDKEITPILGDITQFNKDNGWGKLKIESGLVNFSIPSDILPSMKTTLIDNMQKDQVYLQTYFVRDAGGGVVRLIAVGILPTPKE